jgi:P-type Ca2+ transporter type 2C
VDRALSKNEMSPYWFNQPAATALAFFEVDPQQGLQSTTADQRLRVNGPNVLPTQPQPSFWQVVARTWADPMNVLLTVLIGVSAYAGQPETAVLIALLVLLNVVMGANQELKARRSPRCALTAR